MVRDLQIPYAWRTIIDGDAPPKRLYILTELAEHPHMVGFNGGAKRQLLDAAASAVVVHQLDAFHVLWEISPGPDPTQLQFEEIPDLSVRPAPSQHRQRRTDLPI
jgi:hypothetical protein